MDRGTCGGDLARSRENTAESDEVSVVHDSSPDIALAEDVDGTEGETARTSREIQEAAQRAWAERRGGAVTASRTFDDAEACLQGMIAALRSNGGECTAAELDAELGWEWQSSLDVEGGSAVFGALHSECFEVIPGPDLHWIRLRDDDDDDDEEESREGRSVEVDGEGDDDDDEAEDEDDSQRKGTARRHDPNHVPVEQIEAEAIEILSENGGEMDAEQLLAEMSWTYQDDIEEKCNGWFAFCKFLSKRLRYIPPGKTSRGRVCLRNEEDEAREWGAVKGGASQSNRFKQLDVEERESSGGSEASMSEREDSGSEDDGSEGDDGKEEDKVGLRRDADAVITGAGVVKRDTGTGSDVQGDAR
eukprot:408234-Rhodomonas_salina.1